MLLIITSTGGELLSMSLNHFFVIFGCDTHFKSELHSGWR